MDDKLNILIFLRKILKLYEEAKRNTTNQMDFIDRKNLEYGFCWLIRSFCFTQEYTIKIIRELQKETLELDIKIHWYDTPTFCSLTNGYTINKHALQPRINHLKRTIKRLEKELNIKYKIMAKIRSLKRKLSIIRKIEVREIKKREQGKKHKNTVEEVKYYSVRLTNVIRYKINQSKLKSIINQKT